MQIDPISYTILNGTHSLIGGATGSGKSTLLETFLYNFCHQPPSNYLFSIIDLKRVSLIRWKGVRHCIFYATTIGQAERLIDLTIATMEQRYKIMESEQSDKYKGTKLFLIIDESADLVTENPKIIKKLVHLLRLGRASEIHLIMASQSVDRKTLPSVLQQNTESLFGLRCRDAIASRQIIGCGGCESLPMYGKCLYYTPKNGRVMVADVPLTPEAEIKRIIAENQKPPSEQRKKKKIFQ